MNEDHAGDAVEPIDPLPDMERDDAVVTSFGEWRVADPSRQLAAMDAAIDAWAERPWPDGLLAHACFAAEDGATLRHVAQWSSTDAFESTTADGAERFAAIQIASGTTIAALGVAAYRHHRSFYSAGVDAPVGGIVIVDVTLERPDPQVQRDWIAAVVDALEHQAPDGLVAAHFHTSLDGSAIVNHAEWASVQAHRDAMGAGVAGRLNRDDDPRWDRVRNFPGVADVSRFNRYERHRSLSVARAGRLR